jgi:hypothetical protein
MRFQRVCWSPVEEDYLRSHKEDSINQLTIALAKSRTAINNKLAEQAGRPVKQSKKSGKRTKIGKRKDLFNTFVRSGWEADVYRVLLKQGHLAVQYEPTTFTFTQFGVKHGTVSYCPDFRVTLANGDYIWIEVKGFMKSQDKTKIRRFKKHFPEEFKRLRAVTGSRATAAAKFFCEMSIDLYGTMSEFKKQWATKIPNWESA